MKSYAKAMKELDPARRSPSRQQPLSLDQEFTEAVTSRDHIESVNAIRPAAYFKRLFPLTQIIFLGGAKLATSESDGHASSPSSHSKRGPTKIAQQVHLIRKFAKDLDRATLNLCFDLISSTSQKDYEGSSIGWSPRKKKTEMMLPDLRYVILFGDSSDDLNADQNSGECMTLSNLWDIPSGFLGFLSFMLTYEGGLSVLYIYEIHFSDSVRGLGIGKALMEELEETSKKARVVKLMLTVFRANETAIKFYTKLGYEEDEDSPRAKKLRKGVAKEPDYMIMSKSLWKRRRESLSSDETTKKRKRPG